VLLSLTSKIINPTRAELESLKKKLATARRGHKLLKDKRDGLMRKFLKLVKQTNVLRIEVERKILESNKNFSLARSLMTSASLKAALMVTKQEMTLNYSLANTLGVQIPKFTLNTRIDTKKPVHPYGYASTPYDLDLAIESLLEVSKDMIGLANSEKACQLMASEIEKTRRRVNAIEHVIIPQAESNIRFISMKLSENERSTQVRLIKVKDMILKNIYKN
jgi:V/A-type H+-transporting ATPase subunit D